MNQHSAYNPLVPRHVLVVEDESVQRAMLAKTLPDMGYTCDTAASGEEAIRKLLEKPYTIAMLDLNLPGIQGMELFNQIRDRWPQTSVIILTGYGDLDSAKQAIRMDVVDFLTKPCPLGEIERALDHAYRRYLIVNAEPSKLLPKPAEPIPIDAPKDREDLNLQLIERDAIIEALKRAEGNRTQAAKALGISVRTLYYRLTQYSIMSD
jgi:DNA-binding NtrC family response regulator